MRELDGESVVDVRAVRVDEDEVLMSIDWVSHGDGVFLFFVFFLFGRGGKV